MGKVCRRPPIADFWDLNPFPSQEVVDWFVTCKKECILILAEDFSDDLKHYLVD